MNSKSGVVINCNCNGYKDILQEASTFHYFNSSYFWLIIDHSGNSFGIDNILKPIIGIEFNTEMTFAELVSNGSFYNLIDIYALSNYMHNQRFITKLYGIWNEKNGLQIFYYLINKYNIKYYRRNNFNEFTLKGVTVIDIDNVCPSDVDQLLSDLKPNEGISPFTKYHYVLIQLLKEKYNFTIKYEITRGWAGHLPNGYRLGLLGVIQRNEADIGVTGIFNRINRHDEFDYLHHGYIFEAAFIFRVSSETKISSVGNFLIPFTKIVWLLIGILLIIIIMFLHLMTWIRTFFKFLPKELEEDSMIAKYLEIIATACQQGLDPIPKPISNRILIFVFMLSSLLFYNYYTSSVVGGLLSRPSKGPQNLVDIINSRMILSFENIAYHKILFQEAKNGIVKEMYEKKVIAMRRNENILPVYTDRKSAIPFICKGGHAFHCELIGIYPEIGKEFNANEICDLRTVGGLFPKQYMAMVTSKRNMYTEIFRIGLIRFQEVGLIKRTLRLYQPEKPECQSSGTIHPVDLNQVIFSFIILGAGILISILILILEILHYNKCKICVVHSSK